MYCIKCGSEIPSGSNSCTNCNTPVTKKESVEIIQANKAPVKKRGEAYDASTKGMAATGFFLPPVGILFYLFAKKDTPVRAKTALQGALFGIVTYALAAVIFIYLILPIEKKFVLKYQCIKNTPGATYNYSNYTCTHPNGTEVKIIPK